MIELVDLMLKLSDDEIQDLLKNEGCMIVIVENRTNPLDSNLTLKEALTELASIFDVVWYISGIKAIEEEALIHLLSIIDLPIPIPSEIL